MRHNREYETPYEWASDQLIHRGHGKPMDSRKLANNTYLVRRGDDIAIKLHQTDVVVIHPDNTITLNTGGWYTMTTKDRMNYLTRFFRVSSRRGNWEVIVGDYDEPQVVHHYFDGMHIDLETGFLVESDPETLREIERDRAHNEKIETKIKHYLDGLTAEVVAGFREQGTGGDCWFCSMQTTEGIPLGDAQGDWGHLVNHLDERYYMISLLFNAAADKGYRNPMYIVSSWVGTAERRGEVSSDMKRVLSDYFKSRLYRGAHSKNKAGKLGGEKVEMPRIDQTIQHYDPEIEDRPSAVTRYAPDGKITVQFGDNSPQECWDCRGDGVHQESGTEYPICTNCSQEITDPTNPHEETQWLHLDTFQDDCHVDDLAERGLKVSEGYKACPMRCGTCDGTGRIVPNIREGAPEWFVEHFGQRTWKSSGGYRGYDETEHDLVTLTEGWVTGMPDDYHDHKRVALDLKERLEDDLVPPKPLYWLIEPTSNVFSLASELLVEEDDENEIIAWLHEVGFPLEGDRGLVRAFG